MLSARLRSRLGLAALVSGAVAIAGLIVLAGTARPELAQVSCGDRITTDTRLDRDLVDCRNNGR
jgi:hypothetical protein